MGRRKYRLKQKIKDIVMIVLFYGLIIGSVILVNYRLGMIA